MACRAVRDGEGNFTVGGLRFIAEADAETGTVLIMPGRKGLNLVIERLLRKIEEEKF